MTLRFQAARSCERLRRNFEQREAIYVEKGALRVRVGNVRVHPGEAFVRADVEEAPTPGLRSGMFGSLRRWRRLCWEIESGELSTFSEHTWHCGYGGWSMFFAPRLVRGVVELSRRWPRKLDAVDRYDAVLRWLEENDAYEPTERVLPDAEDGV